MVLNIPPGADDGSDEGADNPEAVTASADFVISCQQKLTIFYYYSEQNQTKFEGHRGRSGLGAGG